MDTRAAHAVLIGNASVTLALRIRQLRAAGFGAYTFSLTDLLYAPAQTLDKSKITAALAVHVSNKQVKPYEVQLGACVAVTEPVLDHLHLRVYV